ncbi:MAG TPA: MBL fold metallo-hydrolase [Kofleriaceae bacterium]|nr:MBL fold metallo-hydrolase [Kofleriaceae bacterium]
MQAHLIRTLLPVLLAAPLVACGGDDDDAPDGPPKLADVLTHAQDALGTSDAERAGKPNQIVTQSVAADGQRFDVGQTFHLGDPPLLIQSFAYARTRDLLGGRVRTAWNRAGGYPTQVPFVYDEISNPTNGYFTAPHNFEEALTFQMMPAMSPGNVDAAQRNREMDEPHVLIAEAIAHPDHVSDFKSITVDGNAAYEFSLARPFAPTRVAVDAKTFLPVQVARLEADAVYGDAQLVVKFSGWIPVAGAMVPKELVRTLGGDVVQQDHRHDYAFAAGADTGVFDVPAGSTAPYDATAAQIGDLHPDLFDRGAAIGLLEGEELTHVNAILIAPNIYTLIGGTHHSIAIGLDHGVIVVEAPNDEGRSLAVEASVAQLFPGKPIQYVISTHRHADHVGGLRTYVAQGVPVVAPAPDLDYYKKVFAAPHTMVPDLLQKTPRDAQLIGVDSTGWSFTDGARTVQAILLPSTHVDQQIVVWVPDAKLAFQSDLFYPHLAPLDMMPLPFRISTHDLYQQLVIDRGLDVQVVASGHADVATGDDFKAAAGF